MLRLQTHFPAEANAMLPLSSATLFNYCERGRDASFWAEPFNAVSNGAFVIAGFAVLWQWSRHHGSARGVAELGFGFLLIVIGTGSFLFHTFAAPWAVIADVVPIGIFMLAYFAYALHRYFGCHPVTVACGLGAFAYALHAAGNVTCGPQLLPITAAAGRPCFNGSLGYVPALAAMLVIGGALAAQRHPAARLVAGAGFVFVISLAARTLDFEICSYTHLFGAVRGTHVMWHLLNAVTLYLLAIAAVRHGQSGAMHGGAS
jgi:Ceramidase